MIINSVFLGTDADYKLFLGKMIIFVILLLLDLNEKNMDKFINTGIILAILSTLIFSSPALAKPYFTGPYVGAGVGVVSQTAKSNIDYDARPRDLAFVTLLEKDIDLGKHGINANVFLGLGHTFNSSYYLGGELFVNYFSPEIKDKLDVGSPFFYSTKINDPYSLGADIRLGYVIFQRIMLYGLIGADYTKFKIKNAIFSGIYTIPQNSDSFNKYLWGILPGIGVEVGLTSHISLRTQYTYTFYPSFSDTVTLPPAAATLIVKTKIKPSRGLFTASLSYLFTPGDNVNNPHRNAKTPYFTGPYLGIGGGVASLYTKLNTSYNFYNRPNIPASWLLNGNLAKHGLNANVFIGYGTILKHYYYLSSELFANYFNPKTKYSYSELNAFQLASVQIKNPYSFGIDIRGGYLVLPRVMVYALLGTDYSKFKFESNGSTIDDGFKNITGSVSDNFDKYRWGIIPGVGVEVSLCDHLALRGQYTYAFYQSFSHTATGKDKNNNTQVLTNKVRPSRSLFTINLSYLWNGL
jgi:opacity protein-like surface antigen